MEFFLLNNARLLPQITAISRSIAQIGIISMPLVLSAHYHYLDLLVAILVL